MMPSAGFPGAPCLPPGTREAQNDSRYGPLARIGCTSRGESRLESILGFLEGGRKHEQRLMPSSGQLPPRDDSDYARDERPLLTSVLGRKIASRPSITSSSDPNILERSIFVHCPSRLCSLPCSDRSSRKSGRHYPRPTGRPCRSSFHTKPVPLASRRLSLRDGVSVYRPRSARKGWQHQTS
jgi:hypothetical protein